MAAYLEWDETGKRDIESGVSQVVLFTKRSSAVAMPAEVISKSSDALTNKTTEYNDGVAWSGVTAISENPGGADVTDLYADNIKYASLRAAETFGFTIEAYTYPDEWMACDGSGSANGATGVAIGQQTRQAFALCYKTQIGSDSHPGMDKGYKLHIVYNSTASPSGRSYATINNSPDAISFSWEANSTPVNVKGIDSLKPTCLITIDSTKLEGGTNNQKLKDLENVLYGTAAVVGNNAAASIPAVLPDPKEILLIMGYTESSGTGG